MLGALVQSMLTMRMRTMRVFAARARISFRDAYTRGTCGSLNTHGRINIGVRRNGQHSQWVHYGYINLSLHISSCRTGKRATPHTAINYRQIISSFPPFLPPVISTVSSPLFSWIFLEQIPRTRNMISRCKCRTCVFLFLLYFLISQRDTTGATKAYRPVSIPLS